MRSANELVQQEMKENPEVLLILEIAARAREIEARELLHEIRVSTEVAAVPINSQCAV
jgi:hypothetical protein